MSVILGSAISLRESPGELQNVTRIDLMWLRASALSATMQTDTKTLRLRNV